MRSPASPTPSSPTYAPSAEHGPPACPLTAERLDASFALVAPALDGALAGPAALERLRALAAALPPVHCAGFECRLDEDDQVDLQQGIGPTDGAPATLAAFLARLAAEGTPLPAAWEGVRRLAAAWADRDASLHGELQELWLEFDVLPGHAPRTLHDLVPSVFVRFDDGRADARTSPDAHVDLARRTLALLLDDAAAVARLTRSVAHVAAVAVSASAGAYVSHVGVMLGRAAPGIRVHLAALPLRALPPCLTTLGWPGDVAEAARQARRLFDFTDTVVVCLDVLGDRVGPALGLECFSTQRHGFDPRWEPLFEQLVAEGLCTPAKHAAIRRWPGIVEPTRQPAPWPASLVAASLAGPPDRFGFFDRRFSHVKLTCAPGRTPAAKAYFGFGHLWSASPTAAATAAHALPASPAPAAPPTLADAADRALGFLLAARNQGGWWRDFYDLARDAADGRRITGYASDEWVSAYIGALLAEVNDPRARAAAAETWDVLAGRRGVPHGWGYHPQLPPDADSTAWGLRLAMALGVPDDERLRAARAFVDAQTRADGAVTCYREADCPAIARFLNMEGPYDGWCAAHTCITAAVALLPGTERSRRFLLGAQEADGRWTGHWWDDDEYATARAVEALVDHAEGTDAVARAARWAASRVSPDGSVHSTPHAGPSAYATALVVHTMAAAAPVCDPNEGAALRRAVRWLLAAQRANGSFPPSARLRVPAPPMVDPLARPETTLTYLDRDAAFTTATVLAALAAARQRAGESGAA